MQITLDTDNLSFLDKVLIRSLVGELDKGLVPGTGQTLIPKFSGRIHAVKAVRDYYQNKGIPNAGDLLHAKAVVDLLFDWR